jgi:hypothetical protein
MFSVHERQLLLRNLSEVGLAGPQEILCKLLACRGRFQTGSMGYHDASPAEI